jgi:hypothetical protein
VGADHPLLALQRSAGNRAVVALVQRQPTDKTARAGKARSYIGSAVALASIEKIYGERCDFSFENVTLRRTWSMGMLSNERSVQIIGGPVTFKFVASNPWFSGRGPWYMDLASGGSGFVTSEVSSALDTIYGRWDEEDAKFWDAVRMIKAALKRDLDQYCAP